MKISGFTFCRNASKLYYPIVESIRSALNVVDEFIVVVGDCDEDDTTRAEVESIDSNKIKIIDTIWDLAKYPKGMEHAHQTDIAKQACNGDWCLYLQADEVLHEDDLPLIRGRCEQYLNDFKVEAMVFDYLHFWGDYQHYHTNHRWYEKEIRVIRNDPEIHSWQSAQSFRRITRFDGVNYRQHKGAFKLNAVETGARIFHYGWVRPPEKMRAKCNYFKKNHLGKKATKIENPESKSEFDYGPLQKLAVYNSTHPRTMTARIARLNWREKLTYEGSGNPNRERHQHEKFKYAILTFIEQKLLGGRQILTSKNYRLLR